MRLIPYVVGVLLGLAFGWLFGYIERSEANEL